VPSYNSMFVVHDKYVLVIEAPGSAKASEVVIDKVKEIAPDKPIRYIVSTHFHYDHI
jgi:glyoxylase-like metal-dependent hydrolase (beta-lactamase superfamily II)